MKRNDILWKAALEDLFDDFLIFFFPDADKLFDFEKGFEYLDKELDQLFPPDDDVYAPKYVDKLVKVFTKDDQEEWILAHIEVQGYKDTDFPKRMFQYYSRIFDKYDRSITAFAIFADTNKNYHPNEYRNEFLGTGIHYRFNSYKIIEQDETVLEASNNPFAMAVLSAKLVLSRLTNNDQQLFDAAFSFVKRLLSKQMPKEKIRKVMSFLRYYIRFDKDEMFTKFVKEISILTERTTTMGIEEFIIDQAKREGRKEGRKEGISQKELEKNITFTKNLLTSTDFSIKKIAELVGVSENFVLDVKNSLSEK